MAGKLALIFTTLVAVSSPVVALWPLPKSITTGSTAVRLAPNFNIQVSVKGAPSDLHDAVTRTLGYLKNDKLERLVIGRGANDSQALSGSKQLSSLTLSLTSSNGTVRSISDEAKDEIESRDEAYTLSVPGDGSAATLKANSTLGLFRGLTTFGQLWYEYEGTTYSLEAPIEIDDKPAYPYRGLMLDTARNYFPVADIKRQLDAMSWVKVCQSPAILLGCPPHVSMSIRSTRSTGTSWTLKASLLKFQASWKSVGRVRTLRNPFTAQVMLRVSSVTLLR